MSTTDGRVYDRGYRPFDGELGGRRAARAALWRTSVRRALGLRRSWRQKVFPWLLLAIVSVPAVVQVGIGYITRDTPASDFEFITYREYVGVSTALLLFVALTAPDLVCTDRRHRILPLLFSRPLTGIDYVVAKLGAIVGLVFAFGILPQILLFVGQMLVSDAAFDYLRDNLDIAWKVPTAVGALAVYYGSFAVAIAAHTTRRLIAAAAFLLTLLVSGIVTGIVEYSGPAGEAPQAWVAATDLLRLPLLLRDLVFLGELGANGEDRVHLASGAWAWAIGGYLVVVILSLGALVRRYRWVEL